MFVGERLKRLQNKSVTAVLSRLISFETKFKKKTKQKVSTFEFNCLVKLMISTSWHLFRLIS